MSAISTRNLSALPAPARLEEICRALAMLEAILMPEWEHRYYSFNAHWDGDERMASMRNGEGDEWFVLFFAAGTFIKGFWLDALFADYCILNEEVFPGVVDQVPESFAAALREPAFTMESTTFCVWRSPTDDDWQVGDIEWPEDEADPDGSEAQLGILAGRPADYVTWAKAYYEKSVPLSAVERIFALEPLSAELVSELNPERDWHELEPDIAEIGYPVASTKGKGT